MADPPQALTRTDSGPLACQDAAGQLVHRVGYASDPWAWTPWQYAHDGRFAGRWDDPDGLWRTLYVGQSRLACYLEVLAVFRPDPAVTDALGAVEEEPEDAADHPTLRPGELSRAWLTPRRIGAAHLHGWYGRPGDGQSLPTLRARFLTLARALGLPDLDAAAIRRSEPRALTQQLAGWLYQQTGPDGEPLTGVRFASRHGDDLTLWALFERPADNRTSKQLRSPTTSPLDASDPELVRGMQHARHHLGRLTTRTAVLVQRRRALAGSR